MLKPYLAPGFGMFHKETENEKINYMEHALQHNHINYKFGPCLSISSTCTSLFQNLCTAAHRKMQQLECLLKQVSFCFCSNL